MILATELRFEVPPPVVLPLVLALLLPLAARCEASRAMTFDLEIRGFLPFNDR
jgi:hypothetical protein